MASSTEILNRFTSLPILLDMLLSKKIILTDYEKWEDKNDSFTLQQYKKQSGFKTLLVCCLTEEHETYHHWKNFSQGLGGVCVEFDKDKLLKSIPNNENFRSGIVEYSRIKDMQDNGKPDLNTFPFFKRKAFEHEAEFRIIYQNRELKENMKEIPISLESIRKITLSPWLRNPVKESVRKIIHGIEGCRELEINSSSLLENSQWKKCFVCP